MKKMSLFMMVSLDGYMEGEDHDLSWHNVDTEFNTFAVEQLQDADTILFGRKTYELMEKYWPSYAGVDDDPVVANLMNNTPKVVVSSTLESVKETDIWKNVRQIRDNVPVELAKLKEEEGSSILVLGSNNLCVTLLQLGLLDEVRLMINPVVIGQGTPLFSGINKKTRFKLESSREFKNGNILLTYTTNN
ncbi:MAG TPA: dihydrofolate reductase family protein [Patescibacteria group bacterium]